MIMGGDKKKMAAMIITRLKPRNEDDMKASNEESFKKLASEEGKESVSPELVAICEDIISAFESKDPHALAIALSSFDEVNDKVEGMEQEPEQE